MAPSGGMGMGKRGPDVGAALMDCMNSCTIGLAANAGECTQLICKQCASMSNGSVISLAASKSLACACEKSTTPSLACAVAAMPMWLTSCRLQTMPCAVLSSATSTSKTARERKPPRNKAASELAIERRALAGCMRGELSGLGSALA